MNDQQALEILTAFLNRSDLTVELIDKVFDDDRVRDPAIGIATNILATREKNGDFSTRASIIAVPRIGPKTYKLMLEKAATGALDIQTAGDSGNNPAIEEPQLDSNGEGIVMRELFKSDGWSTDLTRTERNCHFVNMSNEEKNATFELSLESGRDPSYKAAANFTYQLTPAQAEILGPWMSQIQAAFKQAGLEMPANIGPSNTLAIALDIDSSPNTGYFTAAADFRLGKSLNGEVYAAGLNGSVDITARGRNMPLFLTPFSNDQPRTKVEAINLHRDPRDGNIEAIASTLNEDLQITSEGININRKAPPCGGASVPLIFPSGLLSLPVEAKVMMAVSTLAEEILATLEAGLLSSMSGVLLVANGKHKCVRHIISLMGASIICAFGVYAALAGTVVTEGVASPAFVAAMVACFGSKALVVIDMILAHLGWL